MHSWHLDMRHGRRPERHCRCYFQPMKARSEMTSAFAPGQCIFFFFFRTHFSIAKLLLILDLGKKRIMNDNELQHQDLWCILFKSKIKQILQMQIVFTSTVYSRQSLFLFPFWITFPSWTPKLATLQGLLSCRVANFSSFLLRLVFLMEAVVYWVGQKSLIDDW